MWAGGCVGEAQEPVGPPCGKASGQTHLPSVCLAGLSMGRGLREGRSSSDHPHIHGSQNLHSLFVSIRFG